MNLRSLHICQLLLILPLLAGLAGCASGAKTLPATTLLPAAKPRDFTGHWEKNYQLSDDFNARFGLYIADLRRLYSGQTRSDASFASINGGGLNVDSINGLARFAQDITKTPLIEIKQDENQVSIDREDDFTLHCTFEADSFTSSSNAFGSDQCGWSGERMMFQMLLGGGLSISHQFSLSADASMLNVTTRVSSDLVAAPIVISNYYQRFDPPEENYNCILTLTRSNVCSQHGTAK